MKILAIEKELHSVDWTQQELVLKEEARAVYELYLRDSLREIYFTEKNSAVLVLEAEDKDAAQTILNSLPLVKAGLIGFEIMELRPYTGLKRLVG